MFISGLLRRRGEQSPFPTHRTGRDVKVCGDGDITELSAADASNPDEAKVSVNSASLILIYICPPVRAHPYPPIMTGPCDKGTA